ncbi:MAG: pentapeptide repeat-containing protein [Chloroflexota bacterium]
MPISLLWADEQKTLIWCKFDGHWSWSEFHDIVASARQMINEVTHEVNIVVHALRSSNLPGSVPFSEIEQGFITTIKNLGLVVIITDRPMFRRLLALASQFYNLKDHLEVDPTIRAASAQLKAHKNRQSAIQELVTDLRSGDPVIIQQSAAQLRARRWLMDGSLREASLNNIILSEVNLFMADLRGTNLRAARLQRTNLFKANLENADLTTTDLRGSFLGEANLRSARLANANLEAVNLEKADLRGADLRGANLRGARLDGALLNGVQCNIQTILPDGTHWRGPDDLYASQRPTRALEHAS